MNTFKSVSASLASQRHGASEDNAREEAGPHISKRTADLALGILETLTKSIWRIKQGLCPKNPSVGINGCAGCQEEKPVSVNLSGPPHKQGFRVWVHLAFEAIEEALREEEEVLG